MAKIDQRLQPLLAVLQQEGFSWVVSEILLAIEVGESSPDEIDTNLRRQREEVRRQATSASVAKGQVEHQPDNSRPARQFSPDEQIALAVSIMVKKVTLISNAFAASKVTLSRAFDTPKVALFLVEDQPSQTDVGDDLSPVGRRGAPHQYEVNTDAMLAGAEKLRDLQEDLVAALKAGS